MSTHPLNTSIHRMLAIRIGIVTVVVGAIFASIAYVTQQRELESARAQLIDPSDEQELDAQVSCCVDVFSPVSGRVTRIITESETVVRAGAALLEVGDPSNRRKTANDCYSISAK